MLANWKCCGLEIVMQYNTMRAWVCVVVALVIDVAWMKQAKASKRNSDELQWNTEEGSIFWFRAPL